MKQADQRGSVAELQGLYGPLQILERRIQQVWALQQLQPGEWRTREGKGLRVLYPGRWNRGAGPDFREAVLEIDGSECAGDIEIHLYREDWWRHGHHLDPAYAGVVLHVVLFSGGMDRPITSVRGDVPAEWVMGPWMREDLESVSGGEPGLFGELVPELREWLESDLPETLRERLRAGADRRWQDKEAMARCLFDAAGWRGGLHRMVLYYLGFPFNRRVFYEMAEMLPVERWREPQLLDELVVRWHRQVQWNAGRPANRARRRLGEYLALNLQVPDWTGQLERMPESLLAALQAAVTPTDTRQLRRSARFPDWRRWVNGRVLGGRFSAGMADRLWIDVFLPFLVVAGHLPRESAVRLWLHWPPAAYPDAYDDLLRLAGVLADPLVPASNCWVQGLLWLEDQLRAERIRRFTGSPGSGA